MNVFKNGPIVVPWDFSKQCREALDLAVETADEKASVEVVYVSDSPANFLADVAWDTMKEDIIAKTASEKFKKEVPPEMFDRVHFVTRFGNPGLEIVTYAEEIGANVIVMSTHGRSGVTRLLIGSVADRVIRMAHCPVLVIRGQQAA